MLQVRFLLSLVFVCLLAPLVAQDTSALSALADAGHWKRARQLAENRLRVNPNDAFTLYMSSKIAASFGDLDQGLALAQRAVALDGRNPNFLSQAAEMYARLADRVSIVKQVIYVRQFKKEVDAALAINPRHVDTLLVDIMFLNKAPVYAGGDKKRARLLASELVKIDAAWGHLIEARLAELEKDNRRSEQALLHAVEANPPSYLARYSLARFYCCVSGSRRMDEAAAVARDAIRVDPGRSGGYDILARVFAYQQRWQELDAILTEAERRVPDDLSPFYYAAQVLSETNQDPQRAERYLRKYLSQEPEGRQPTASDGRQLLSEVSSRLHHPLTSGM